MSLTFTDSDAQSTDGFCKFLGYGLPGLGKTMLVATLPDVALISIEKGLMSLNPQNQLRVFGMSVNVPVLEIADVEDLNDALRFFISSKDAERFQSVGLDSISDIAEVVLSNAKKTAKDPRQAYGILADQMTQVIRGFRDLPKHVYFSAKQERLQDASGLVRFGPSMPGKQLTEKSNIAHFFDEVFAMDVTPRDKDGNTYRFLRTAADETWNCKDRSGRLDAIEEPHLGKIIAKIRKQD